MIKEILLITLLLSVVFISGCVQQPTVTGEATAEGQAMKAIEQEMEEAIENMTMEDIENAIIEQ
ncbi:MAG: hypothetical protein B6U68_03265 [Candidatus Aenigmarchaeota archaeon ex4484_14]|nr:MAG: hypothetical protein B6U68_03265 [Candidatus Aenigmarchaeota archaeon ex4484_14]